MRFVPTARMSGSATPKELMRALMISIAFVSFCWRAESASRPSVLSPSSASSVNPTPPCRSSPSWSFLFERLRSSFSRMLFLLSMFLSVSSRRMSGEELAQVDLGIAADLLEADELARDGA